MDMVSRLSQDMNTARKAGQKQRLEVLRMILSDAQVADLRKITPEQAVDAYAKKLAKSIEEFQKYGRNDEVVQLTAELAIVREYLPSKATPEQTQVLVEKFLSENRFTPDKSGQAIGAFMKLHGPQVEPGTASRMIRDRLGSG